MTASSLCPGCGSALLQPLRCRPRRDGTVEVEQRCPECFAWMQEAVSSAEVRELDRHQAALRREIVGAYERCVAESMEALAACFASALALDLVSADDFRPRGAAA